MRSSDLAFINWKERCIKTEFPYLDRRTVRTRRWIAQTQGKIPDWGRQPSQRQRARTWNIDHDKFWSKVSMVIIIALSLGIVAYFRGGRGRFNCEELFKTLLSPRTILLTRRVAYFFQYSCLSYCFLWPLTDANLWNFCAGGNSLENKIRDPP
jgi:hypothetical protein